MDLSIILFCQQQGRRLNAAVAAIAAAKKNASVQLGINIEWIITSSQPTEPTRGYLHNHRPEATRIIVSDAGDRAGAINQAIVESRGAFISIVDGWDLVSSNWFAVAFLLARSQPANMVFHPAMIVSFGRQPSIYLTPDQQELENVAHCLFVSNLWPTTTLAARSVFIDHPFCTVEGQRGFGHHNWHWSCQTVAGGIVHRAVETTFACCRKEHDCLSSGQQRDLLLMPCTLFQRHLPGDLPGSAFPDIKAEPAVLPAYTHN